MAKGQPVRQDAPTEVWGHSWPALGYTVVDNLLAPLLPQKILTHMAKMVQ